MEDSERVAAAARQAIDLCNHGRIAASESAAAEAVELAGENGRDRAVALHARGFVRNRCSDFLGAVSDLTAALRHAEDAGEMRLEALVLAELGFPLHMLGDAAQGIDRLTRALVLAQRLGDGAIEGEAYSVLANAYSRLDDATLAVAYAERALHLARERGDPVATVNALRALGNVRATEVARAVQLGLSPEPPGEQAIAAYAEAIPLARDLGNRPMEAGLVNNVAHTLRLLGRAKDTVDCVEQVLARGTDELPAVSLSLLYFNLGDARARLGETAAALAPMCEALRLAESGHALMHLPTLHLGLADLYESLGDPGRALFHHKAYHEVEDQLRAGDIRSRALLTAMRREKEQLTRESNRWREEKAALSEELRALREEASRLDDQARRDPLTSLANRRIFDQWLRRIGRATSRAPVSLALIDVDRFKSINDTFSHVIGDEVLRRIGRVLGQAVRSGDLAARYGGEEFALVLPHTPLSEAAVVCERVRRTVADTDWSAVGRGLWVTVSAGVAQEPIPANALAVADQRLYAAKLAGRNRVVAQ